MLITLKNMKHLLFFICISTLLMTSCATKAEIIFDDSIAVEKTAWICPGNVGTIISYNEIEVNWKGSKFIQIPAGNTLLEWNIYSSIGNTTYRAENILSRYNFLPGKQYYFIFGRDPEAKEEGTGVLGIKVYVYDIGETINRNTSEMKKHFDGFAPFLNLNARRRTVLE